MSMRMREADVPTFIKHSKETWTYSPDISGFEHYGHPNEPGSCGSFLGIVPIAND